MKVGCRGFIANLTSVFLTNFGPPPSDKRKYMDNILDKVLTAQHWYGNPIERQQSDKVWWCRERVLGRSELVVMMLQPRNHAWIQSHHLLKALLEAIIIIIIMSCHQHGYPWPSLATFTYRLSPPAGLLGYILCPHIAAVCKFGLVVLLLLGHMWGSIVVRHLRARLCFSSSVQRVWLVWPV